VLSYVGRGLCDGLITRPEELYRMCQLYVIKKIRMVEENFSSEEKSSGKNIIITYKFIAE
jgi:hypothetical protein